MLALFLLLHAACGQEIPAGKQQMQRDYLTKSRQQQTAAWILLGAGATMIAVAARGNISFDVLPVLVVGGVGGIGGSIPLFIASGRNKRKARQVGAHLHLQQYPVVTPMGKVCKGGAAVSVSCKF